MALAHSRETQLRSLTDSSGGKYDHSSLHTHPFVELETFVSAHTSTISAEKDVCCCYRGRRCSRVLKTLRARSIRTLQYVSLIKQCSVYGHTACTIGYLYKSVQPERKMMSVFSYWAKAVSESLGCNQIFPLAAVLIICAMGACIGTYKKTQNVTCWGRMKFCWGKESSSLSAWSTMSYSKAKYLYVCLCCYKNRLVWDLVSLGNTISLVSAREPK